MPTKGSETLGLLNKLFSKKDEGDNTDAIFDAIVSYSTDDGSAFIGAGALRNPDVWAAVRRISTDVASSPVIYSDTATSAGKHLQKLVSQAPTANQNAFAFWQTVMVNVLLNGNAFVHIVRTDSGTVSELRLIPCNRMTVKQDDNDLDNVSYYVDNTQQIPTSDVLHFRCLNNPDGYVGLSPLYALRDQLGIQKAKNKLLQQYFDHGLFGTGILKVNGTELDEKQKANIRNKFEQSVAGDNALRVIVLDQDMSFSNLPINTDLVKLANELSGLTDQIAAAFGIPASFLGNEEEHSNQSQVLIPYLENTLEGYFAMITSELNLKLATNGNSFKFDTSDFFTADPSATYQMYEGAVQAGLLTPNEARQKLGLPPLSTNQVQTKNGSEGQSEPTEPKVESEDTQTDEQ